MFWFQNGFNKVVMNFGLCNFGLKSYLWFQIEWARSASSILKPRIWFQTKLHSSQFNYHYETSAFRVKLFQLLYSIVGRLEEFIVETFRVKPSEWLYWRLFIYISTCSYTDDEVSKHGIGEVQWLFQSNAWYNQQYLLEETETI